MKQIIGKRGTGKTKEMLMAAKEINAVVACANPKAMETKSHAYGIIGVTFINYNEIASQTTNDLIMIDDLDEFLKYTFNNKIVGYTLTEE